MHCVIFFNNVLKLINFCWKCTHRGNVFSALFHMTTLKYALNSNYQWYFETLHFSHIRFSTLEACKQTCLVNEDAQKVLESGEVCNQPLDWFQKCPKLFKWGIDMQFHLWLAFWLILIIFQPWSAFRNRHMGFRRFNWKMLEFLFHVWRQKSDDKYESIWWSWNMPKILWRQIWKKINCKQYHCVKIYGFFCYSDFVEWPKSISRKIW